MMDEIGGLLYGLGIRRLDHRTISRVFGKWVFGKWTGISGYVSAGASTRVEGCWTGWSRQMPMAPVRYYCLQALTPTRSL